MRAVDVLCDVALGAVIALSSCSVDDRRLGLATEGDGGEAPEAAAGGAPGETQGGAPSLPAVCGNGALEEGEACDDGGEAEQDGCNVACELEPGYECSGEPSSCRACEGAAGLRRCAVAGGAFERGPDEARGRASVSRFSLDELEVTVGRFRRFVSEFEGAPTPGAGAHPEIPNSGWRQEWSASLPSDRAALIRSLHCAAQWETWTDEPGEREDFPVNCLSYYVGFAFCVAQGGRLPTEAEWEYAAAGGAQQRPYPWGDGMPSTALALFDSNALERVGARVAGRSRFGQLDLAGSLWEWSLDWRAPYEASCDRCAELENGFERVLQGGYFLGGAEYLRASYRFSADPALPLGNVGVRCAYRL